MSIDELLEEARAFLDANAQRKPEQVEAFAWGRGSDDVSLFEEVDPERERAELAEGKRFAGLRFDAGFGWVDGPIELGGRGLSAEHADAYAALEDSYEIPNLGFLNIARGYVAPTLRMYARPEIQRHYLPRMYRGDVVVCQLFSEPNAGSDLAAATTRATRQGDEWVITGQKVWTSNAHVADVGFAVCRTNVEVPKHHGLTTFLVDMHAAGVEVRPLRQMTGGAGFNEVFLTEVRVPDSHRVGDVDAGFGVVLTTLGNERVVASRGMSIGRGIGSFERLVGLVQHYGDPSDAVTRQQLAQLFAERRVRELTGQRWLSRLEPGDTPGPEMAVLKLLGAHYHAGVVALLSHVLGPRLVADTGEWGTYAWARFVLGVPGGRIGGGTDEIVRNTLGERVLGLPKEPKPV
jgi:alkylation response protein AidB-like acyl-CoA dehydrogenase